MWEEIDGANLSIGGCFDRNDRCQFRRTTPRDPTVYRGHPATDPDGKFRHRLFLLIKVSLEVHDQLTSHSAKISVKALFALRVLPAHLNFA